MASRPDSGGHPQARIVRLMCAQCDTRLGTFENEWIRLTSSYARPKQRGRHTMTEIGNRVQQVPTGVSQKAAEGCGMAEVFCRVCSCLVGQYCKTAPNREKQWLVDNYFYKFSKTYLIAAESLAPVDPVFTYGGDPTTAATPVPGPPKSRSSMPARVRSRDLQPRHSLDQHSCAQVGGGGGVVPDHLSLVEGSSRLPEHGSRGVTQSGGSLERSDPRQKGEEYDVVNDQQKQLTALTNQINSLKSTVHDLSSLVLKICAERQEPGAQTSTPAHSAAEKAALLKDSQAPSDELERLRTENEQLRRRFAMIESVMGVKPGGTGRGLGNGLTSEDQLLTPGASQQSSFEIKPSDPISPQQAESEVPHEGEPSQQTDVPQESMGYDDDVHAGEDTEMQLGNEPSAEPCSDRPALNQSTPESPNQSTPESPRPDEEQQTLGAADRSSSAPSHGNSQPTVVPTQNPVALPSQAKPGTRRRGRGSTGSRPQLQYSPHQPLFGVMRPVKKVQKAKQSADAQLPQLDSPELPPGSRRYAVAAPKLHEAELVEFSDDENPVPSKDATVNDSQPDIQLHYGPSLSGPPRAPGVSPWIPRDQMAVDHATPFAVWDLNSSSRPSSSGPGSADFQIKITGPEQVRDCLERGESPFRDIKEPQEKKTVIQTTEKLLNEELVELGMEEWISKDKNTKEYRQVTNKPGPKKSSKRTAAVLDNADVQVTTSEDLPETDSPQTMQAASRKSSKFWPDQVSLGEDMNEPLTTRRQTRAAEMYKLQTRGQEVVESEVKSRAGSLH
ncbi:hypothetical protein DV737_g1095, partial [Chaetothyriales sp. CBS 132003]